MFGHRQQGWLGIDWGTRTIKLASLRRTDAGLVFSKKTIVRRSEGPSSREDGRVAFRDADFPQALIKDGTFRASSAACVLPLSIADLRTLPIPDVDSYSRRKMILGELADTLSEDDAPRVVDYWDALPGVSHRAGPLVHVYSLPEALTTRVAQTITRTGPVCEVIDALPLAMGRAIQLLDRRQDSPHLGLDWGYSGASLTAFRGARPLYCRSLRDCGLDRLAADLAETLGVSTVEAEQVLMERGLPGRDSTSEIQELTAQVIADGVRSLIEQMETTLSYIEAEWPGTIVDGLWLFGGAAGIKNMAYYLGEKTGLDVRTWCLPGTDQPENDGPFGIAASLSALAWES